MNAEAFRHRNHWSEDSSQEQLISPHVVHDAWGRTRVFRTTPLMRIQKRIIVTDSGCHEFQGFRNNHGYGQVGIGRKLMYVHRAMWIITNGDIPPNMCVCHRCDNPPCCNPEHLFLGTHRENGDDMVAKGRTPLRYGAEHPLSKFTEEERAAIKAAHIGGESYRALGRRYGCCATTIGRICRDEHGGKKARDVSRIPPKVRKALADRARIGEIVCCEICGIPGNNAHHRRNQSQGGEHVLSNLMLLCGSGTTGCHGFVTTNPAAAVRNGWTIQGTVAVPSETPVRRRGELVWLDNFGGLKVAA